MKQRLVQYIGKALQACFDQQQLHSGVMPEIGLEVPAHTEHGDFSTNIAMAMARAEKKAPRKIAEAIVAALGDGDGMWDRIEIAGPGFINFYLTPRCWFGMLDEVYRQGELYGRTHTGAGRKVQVEFVSANPTGPLHIGHGRGACYGRCCGGCHDRCRL